MASAIDSDITYEDFVQQNLCRLCWVLVKKEIAMKTEQITDDLLDKVLDCLGINLNETVVPNKICDYCIAKVEAFYEYKSLCTRANEKLSIIIESHENKKKKSISSVSNRNLIKKEVRSLYSTDDSDASLPVNVNKEKKTTKNKRNTKVKMETANSNSEGKCTDRKKKRYVCKKSPTYCNICHLEQHTNDQFWQHCAEAHGIEEFGTKFKCYGCDKRFPLRRSRLRHEIHFCNNLKKGYKCRLCDKFLQNRKTLEEHTRNHDLNEKDTLPDFCCRFCKEPFDNKEDVEAHKQAEHASEPPQYICEECGRIFLRQDYLRKHMWIHRGIKNYKCTECGHITRERSSLVIHMRRHTGERPYSCDLCDIKCISQSNLTAHKLRHLGVKKYECSICSKRFGYKSSYEHHMVSIHGQGERSQKYACDDCGIGFPRDRDLQRHKKSVHKTAEKPSANKTDEEEGNEMVVLYV